MPLILQTKMETKEKLKQFYGMKRYYMKILAIETSYDEIPVVDPPDRLLPACAGRRDRQL